MYKLVYKTLITEFIHKIRVDVYNYYLLIYIMGIHNIDEKKQQDVVHKFDNFLRGHIITLGQEKKIFSEKGTMDFIRSITALLSSVMDNLESDLSKQEMQRQIRQNNRACKKLIFEHCCSNGKDGILPADMVPIYQTFVNYVNESYRGLKRDGKFKNYLIERFKSKSDIGGDEEE